MSLARPPTLIRNVRIWTGEKDGDEVIDGDVLIDKGIIKSVGKIPMSLFDERNGSVKLVRRGRSVVDPGPRRLAFAYWRWVSTVVERGIGYELAQGAYPALVEEHRRAEHAR